MKKEYLIGGLLGVVLVGIVVYAVMSVMSLNEGGTGSLQIQEVKEQTAAAPQSTDISRPAVVQQPVGQDDVRQDMSGSSSADNSNAAVTEKKSINETPSPAGEPSDGRAAAEATGAQPGDSKLVKGLSAEQASRLDQITERKSVLQPERDKLIREREQLHADVKNAGVIRTRGQLNAITTRITELEARINGFNAEVKKLNEEEKAILDSHVSK